MPSISVLTPAKAGVFRIFNKFFSRRISDRDRKIVNQIRLLNCKITNVYKPGKMSRNTGEHLNFIKLFKLYKSMYISLELSSKVY